MIFTHDTQLRDVIHLQYVYAYFVTKRTKVSYYCAILMVAPFGYNRKTLLVIANRDSHNRFYL